MARTYYCKCGLSFKKNIIAEVTGYALDISENEVANSSEYEKCLKCPFRNKVVDWPNTFKRWECRAGSKTPNNTTDYVGSLDDKCNIHIRSLNYHFLESILAYCKNQSDISGGYTQDISDCRRVLSLYCSQNKKGIAAKKELINKFFPNEESVSITEKNFENKSWLPEAPVTVPGPVFSFGYKVRCPYLSSLGQKSILCTLHARCLGEKKFNTEGETSKYSSEFCFNRFDECELYKSGYEREISSIDKWVLEYRKCVYCCNSSGAIGLVKNHHGTHCFCQVHRDERPNYDTNSLCGWFNKKYPPGATLFCDMTSHVLPLVNIPNMFEVMREVLK